jgi:3-deoxy-7-phosphoheptulonate synthase
MSEADVEWAAEEIDLVQIGSRNMQNYALLRAVGESGASVLLKRGASANLSTWRLAAEHLLYAGARDVILCERGIAGPDMETRNVLDLGAVALLKEIDGLVVMVDPSHAGGRRDLVMPLSKAALAVGADGLLVEVHPNASDALSDGPQALNPEELRHLADAIGTERSLKEAS